MKLLHTSDWHVGKTLRGLSRLEEQERVLAEIAEIAKAEAVDVALVAGDLFESAAPSPEAQRVAWRALLDLSASGAKVVVIAGNHDNPQVFEALRPVFAGAGITVLGRPAGANDGGVVQMQCAGEPLNLALLPFCSQRGIIRTAELLLQDAAANAARYAERVAAVVAKITEGFADDAVNIVAAHGFVRGGRLGGGERDAQTIEDYWIDANAFGTRAHYVALGHLHLTQQIAGGCPIWYSGSPIQVDFGEEGDAKHVLVVEARPGVPIATPRQIRLKTPRRLRTLRGTLPELAAQAAEAGDDLLRVFVQDTPVRAGLAAEVRQLIPNAVDVFVERPEATTTTTSSRSTRSRSAHELFASYLTDNGIADTRIDRLFARLLDEQTQSETAL